MGKYDPLTTFLKRQKGDVVELSFGDIERRLGALLPKAANVENWWQADGVQTRAWTPLGFHATLDPGAERVRFERRATLTPKI